MSIYYDTVEQGVCLPAGFFSNISCLCLSYKHKLVTYHGPHSNTVSHMHLIHQNPKLDHILAVGAHADSTAVTYGESYDRRSHGSVYLFQQNLCCMKGTALATTGASSKAKHSRQKLLC